MSNETFQVDILTPERKVLEIKATQVVVQALSGSMGIKASHVPMVSPLTTVWPVRVWPAEGEDFEVAICGGFVEVHSDRVSILAQTAELPAEIDLDRAERAKERAEERLKRDKGDVDFNRAETALQRALMRLGVAESGGHLKK